MGNRYTQTTMTQREVNTLTGCFHKLNTIYRRRKDNPQENQEVIAKLFEILVKMDNLDILVQDIREDMK